MFFRLEDEDEDEAKDDEHQEKDTFPLARVFLVSTLSDERKENYKGVITDFVATFKSLTASSIWTEVCSMLYSTLSSRVP